PDEIVREICDGLLANDSVAFQTDEAVENFMATCRAYLAPKAQVWERRGEIEYRGHVTTVWANPISVDVEELEELAASDEVLQHYKPLEASRERFIVRVDRLDPSKNIVRGFLAYEQLLERNPGLRGEVR